MAKESNRKIELLQTDYAKEQFAKFEKERRQVVFRRRRLVAFFVAALAIFAIVGIQMFNDQMRLQKLKEYKAETVAEQKEAEQKVASLERDVALLKDDEYVAKLARSRFFYSKDGEKIYPVLPDGTDSQSTNEDSSQSEQESSSTESQD
ncbi:MULTISPECIES: FtsB family cell division protein [Enterococcus]|uniref:FtsB family cell division protein n=1 Tax=Enterococcus TaxID=1350 RepID=UPI001903B47E|nr:MULTISPECIES: septum formation initiator family protein [unclassified Enterococcus]MBK0038468.1 septum formation initiator family protein [Enterococcus sp. S52]MBK0071426.1 septum formation initiator family protein [Enterococcus sp. S53]MBK0141858.1 septum formation initiator family protein [Enterococcus sp. S76]MBK0145587.1 septum formation initiator family protein [Enterococcus sp. S77]